MSNNRFIFLGYWKNLEIVYVETSTSPKTYKAVHSYTNPMTKKELRIIRNYSFNILKNNIIDKEDILIEIKSSGEWVKAF